MRSISPRCNVRRPRCMTVIGVLSAFVLIGVYGLLAIQRARPSNVLEQKRAVELQVCYRGLAGYQNLHQCLPQAILRDEAGNALSSWRLVVAPWCEGHLPDFDLESTWDSAINSQMRQFTPRWFCLADLPPGARVRNTNVCAVTGPGTAFDEGSQISLKDLPADLILLLDVADFDEHWMEPGDLTIGDFPPSVTSGLDGTGVHVVFADGAVWQLTPSVPLEVLRRFLTIDQARLHDREDELGPFAVHKHGRIIYGSHLGNNWGPRE